MQRFAFEAYSPTVVLKGECNINIIFNFIKISRLNIYPTVFQKIESIALVAKINYNNNRIFTIFLMKYSGENSFVICLLEMDFSNGFVKWIFLNRSFFILNSSKLLFYSIND